MESFINFVLFLVKKPLIAGIFLSDLGHFRPEAKLFISLTLKTVIVKNASVHTTYDKKSKHEFCVLASKHALWCKNRSSLNRKKLSLMMKIYTNWAFLRPVLHLPLWWLYYRKPSFSMYLLSTQEHAIPLCVKILQILIQLELSWFLIEGNVRFWDFLTFNVPLCSKKLSVQWSYKLLKICKKALLRRPKKT